MKRKIEGNAKPLYIFIQNLWNIGALTDAILFFGEENGNFCQL